MMASYRAFCALAALDPNCADYIEAYADATPNSSAPAGAKTPRMVCPRSSSRTRRNVSSVTTALRGSAEMVIARQSMTMSLRGTPKRSAIYAAMLFGYLDDRSEKPWGELRKGLLDAAVSIAIAVFVFKGHAESAGGSMKMICWVPFVKTQLLVPGWIYIPVATFIIWFTMNATNCSDGVDGLAGSLSAVALVMLAVILYVVTGYRPVAHYFLIPVYSESARWAIVAMTAVGSLGGYLWYNAEPSQVLMGDAGSRFLGVLVATACLMTGNPFVVLALSPVVLVNGGGGLVKLVLLRFFKAIGRDISQGSVIRRIRFPLHDHFKKNLGWSNAQVLMRFVLLQLAVTPLLFILLLKIR